MIFAAGFQCTAVFFFLFFNFDEPSAGKGFQAIGW
jgi:hypothetical protein